MSLPRSTVPWGHILEVFPFRHKLGYYDTKDSRSWPFPDLGLTQHAQQHPKFQSVACAFRSWQILLESPSCSVRSTENMPSTSALNHPTASFENSPSFIRRPIERRLIPLDFYQPTGRTLLSRRLPSQQSQQLGPLFQKSFHRVRGDILAVVTASGLQRNGKKLCWIKDVVARPNFHRPSTHIWPGRLVDPEIMD
jgi:hypothetical protein